jgi:outer membrane protein
MGIRTVALLCLLMGLGHASISMAESEKAVTLDEAIQLALERNPLLAASRQDLIGSESDQGLARAALFPKIDLSESYMRTNNPVSAFGTLLNQANFTSADFAVDRLDHPEPVDNFRFRITLTQPIYNGNREYLGLRMAGIGQEIAAKSYDTARQRVIFTVTEAYDRRLLAKERLKVAQEAEQIAEEDLRQIQSRYEHGIVVKSDLLGAEVRLADVKEERIRAENNAALTGIVLKNAIGLTEEVETIGDLEKPRIEPPALPSLMEEAKKSRPDYQMLRHRLAQTETEVDLARSAFLPNLNLQGSYEVNNRTLTTDGSDSYTVLAVLSFNLFNGLGDQARLRRAKAQREKQEALLVEQAQGIELEVATAYLDLTAAQKRIQVHEEAVDQAKEHLRIVRNRYQTGITTILDLLTAEHLLAQAQTARIQSLYDYGVGLARLDLVTGRLGSAYGREAPK